MDEVDYPTLCEAMKYAHNDWRGGLDSDKEKHMKVSGPWLHAFLALMWLTGARVSEVLALRGRDIRTEEIGDIQVARINLPNLKQRGRNSQKVVVCVMDEYPACWEYIDKYHEALWNQDGLLFPRSRKTAWYHCQKIFGLGTHRVGRHSWVMNHARKDTPILDVKQQGGWTALQSMNAYIHEFGAREIVDRQVLAFRKRKESLGQ